MRDQIVSKIEEKDLLGVQNMLVTIFNNNITYEKMLEFYKQSVNSQNVHLYGYYINDQIVGMIMLNIAILPAGRKATIWDLAVLEEYRHQGIATKLINKIEDILKEEKDIKKIWLFSGMKRTEAHRLYQKLGYNGNDNKAFYKIINI